MNKQENENKLQKVTKKKRANLRYSLSFAAIIFIIAISIIVPINHNKNVENPIKQVKQENGLPKIENFENKEERLANEFILNFLTAHQGF